MTFARRGRRVLAPPALVLRDPFGLAQRVLSGGRVDEVLVLPRISRVRVTASGGDAVSAHARAALIAAAETEIDGLREHREGSPASRIHWPTLARGAGLMERKLISEADSRPLVVLDPRAPASPDALDAAVRAAASLTVHFAKRTGCGLLLPGDRRAVTIDPDLLAWPQAHVRLALMEEHVGPALSAAQNRRGLVVYVAARVVDRPPRGLGRTPGGCLMVLPGRDRGAQGRARGVRLPRVRGRPDRERGGHRSRRRRRLSSPAAARPPVPVLRTVAARGPALPLTRVRGLVLLVFALFAGLHWMSLIEPAEWWRAWEAVGIAALVVLLLRGAALLPRAAALVAATLVAIGAFALALLAGGVADEDLRPDRWSDVAGGIGRGIDSLPGVRVPYRGLDEWTHMVLGIGGTLLIAVSPRCSRSGRAAAGGPATRRALIVLLALYVIPAVVLDFEGEFVRGAVLAVLMVAFLRLEKLGVYDAPAAGIAAVAAALAALLAAPALDGRTPWWDYERWALDSASAARRDVLVGPRLQPARLAARRARAAAREGDDPGVLEGERPRPVRRAALAPRPAGVGRASRRPAARRLRRTASAGARTSRSRCAT